MTLAHRPRLRPTPHAESALLERRLEPAEAQMLVGALEALYEACGAVEDLVDVTTMPHTAQRFRAAMRRAGKVLGRRR